MNVFYCIVFFFKQKTAYEMRISDWSSDVCSSDLWFPGGIIVGGLAGFFLSAALPWQGIMALVMIPAAATVIIAATTTFPPPLREQSGVSFGEMVGEVFRRPSFFIWFAAMFLTAASELAPRSDEHTSELQSLMRTSYAVFCLKKK